MSHHLDTPLAAKTGQLLIDDLYVFPGEGVYGLTVAKTLLPDVLVPDPGLTRHWRLLHCGPVTAHSELQLAIRRRSRPRMHIR